MVVFTLIKLSAENSTGTATAATIKTSYPCIASPGPASAKAIIKNSYPCIASPGPAATTAIIKNFYP